MLGFSFFPEVSVSYNMCNKANVKISDQIMTSDMPEGSRPETS